MRVRPEAPGDHGVVFHIVSQAFGNDAEAKLVDELRAAASPQISLVADEDGIVLGHIFFSPATVGEGPDARKIFALGPVGVRPDQQNRALGSALVRAGLERCLAIDEPVVVVLGHPPYYPRFGFRQAHEHGLYYKSRPGPNPAFMVAELRPGALEGLTGEVHYHPAFDAV